MSKNALLYVKTGRSRLGISTVVAIAVVLAIIVIAGVGAYLALVVPKNSGTRTTSTSLQFTQNGSISTTVSTFLGASSSPGPVSLSSTSSVNGTTSSQSMPTSSSSSSNIQTNRTTSSVTASVNNNNFFNITVTKMIDDTPESNANGKPVYIFDVTIVNVGNNDSNIVPADFELVGASNTVYAEQNALAMTIPTEVFISPGQQTTMQVAFALSPGDSPKEIKYVGNYYTNTGSTVIDITSQLPQRALNVSWVSALDTNVTGSAASDISVTGAQLQNYSTPASLGYYYTGDIIAIQLSFGYQIGYSGNATLQVTAISNSGGFKVEQITPPLPISVTSSGATVMMYLITPQTSFSGTLLLDIAVS